MHRECGDCTVCCYVGGVPELGKPAHKKCCYENKGCSIYNSRERPSICNNFQCAWLRGIGSENDRPDINGVMCSDNFLNGGHWVFVIELIPEAATTSGLSMVKQLVECFDIPVIISNYDSIPPNDTGDRVIIKDSLKTRSKKLMGELIQYLDDDKVMGIYKLTNGSNF